MSRILAKNCLLKLIINSFKNAAKHSRKFNASSSKSDKGNKKPFNTPHPPKDPGDNYNPPCLEHEAFEIPDFIPAAVFRSFTSKNEKLGPGASKNGCYKNPEYYSYHRYSFFALQVLSLKLRDPESSVRCLYGKEDCDVEKYSSDEDKPSSC